MKAFKNYNEIKGYTYTEQAKLPAGAYEVKIIKAEELNGGSCLAILFDIVGGEFDNYYHTKYRNDCESPFFKDKAKYKGVFRLWYPDGGQYSEQNERRIKTTLENIKKSNSTLKVDFTKEWDGAVLKGCKVGMVFREQEWEYNNNRGTTAQPFQVITLDDLANGNYNIPEPKLLSSHNSYATPAPTTSSTFESVDDDDDLPF